jgi:hypothetical protein
MPSPIRYRVQIHSDGPRHYRTTGSAAVSAANPMVAAAQSLLASGAPIDAMLSGTYEGAAISAVSLASIVRPRKTLKTDHRAGTPGRNTD